MAGTENTENVHEVDPSADGGLSTLTWMTRGDVATYARAHVRTVDRWANDGLINRYRVRGLDKSVRFKREEVEKLFTRDTEENQPFDTPGSDPFAD